MKRCTVLFVALLLLAGSGGTAVGMIMGPHWVDTAPEGFETAPSVAYVEVQIYHGPLMSMSLSGPTTIYEGPPNVPIPAGEPGHTATIQTEIVSMNLTGEGYSLRAGQVFGLPQSLGKITERSDDDALADSFFDVFVEIKTPEGDTFYNDDPAHVEAIIPGKPPIGIPYIHFGSAIPLFDVDHTYIGDIVYARHTLTPEPSSLIVWGLLGAVGITVGWWRRRRGAA